jgi:signal transduction histidine kinase
MVASYLRSTTDLALKHKLAHELTALGAPVPAEIAAADADWSTRRAGSAGRSGRERSRDRDDDRRHDDGAAADEAYDGELAAIYVLPLTAQVRPAGGAAPPFTPDQAAARAALSGRGDLRTTAVDGAPVRLLTYPTGLAAPALLQLGRPLGDQESLLGGLVGGLLALGAASALAVGAGSWWLAGRSIAPAEQAWERQRRFVANASHELRAPLALLRASTEVARRDLGPEQADQRALLDDALAECDHVARLVDDLLLLSRGDAGGLALAWDDLPLDELVDDVSRTVARLAEERGVALRVEPGGGRLRADRARLRQVLLILLDNALGHTPTGGRVRVAAAVAADEAVLTVEDTGPGIAPADLPRVFEPFYRSARARADGRDGSGLGLPIARMLVEAHGGTIRLTSAPGGGTRAEIRLPRPSRRCAVSPTASRTSRNASPR